MRTCYVSRSLGVPQTTPITAYQEMHKWIISVLILVVMYLAEGMDTVWTANCQLLRYPAFLKQRLWWTHDGRQLPSLTFQMRNAFGSSQVQSRFDLAAAGEGWDQLSISSDGQSFWVQQLCMDRIDTGYTVTEGIEQYAQPLFHGLRASTASWCRSVHFSELPINHVGSVTAYPIHYEVHCVKQVLGDKMQLLVRMKLDQVRWVYQCLRIRTLGNGSLIQILQSQSYAFEPRESLCGDLNTFESTYWIGSLRRPDSQPGANCPFDGGFQVTSIKSLNREKELCDYQTYATMESECVIGDGIDWSFDDPKCNIFEFKQVTKLHCLVNWEDAGIQFTLLRLSRDDDGQTVYTMIYTQIPNQLSSGRHSYESAKPIWIGSGMRLPAKLLDTVTKTGYTMQPREAFIRKSLAHYHMLTAMWNEGARIFEVYARRAFGICDDERVACDRGCDFDARNRLFCYKTCASDDKKCDIPQWDSCQFGSNYHGIWDLIDLKWTTEGQRQIADGNQRHSVHIWGKHIQFSSPNSSPTVPNVTLQCVHEVSETIRDWFVVRTVNQQNGCRPRDLCLELYQSEVRNNYVEKNTHTLLFRLSQSQKQGTSVKALCDFRSTAHSTRLIQPKILIKQTKHVSSLTSAQQVTKCGLYQIRLSGTMIINTFLLQLTHQRYRVSKSDPMDMNRQLWTDQWTQSASTHASMTQPYTLNLEANTRYARDSPRFCSVQLSDFNRSYGVTGEFDNMLRVKTACSNPLVSQMLNTTHKCISVYNLEPIPHRNSKHRMIITFNSINGEYYCWIFDDASKGAEKIYIVHIFNTLQCRYTQTPSGEIIVDEELALIRMNLTPGVCLNCQRAWNDQQITSNEVAPAIIQTNTNDRSAAKHSLNTVDLSKQRAKMRSLRVGSQIGRSAVAPYSSTAKRTVFIFTFCVLHIPFI